MRAAAAALVLVALVCGATRPSSAADDAARQVRDTASNGSTAGRPARTDRDVELAATFTPVAHPGALDRSELVGELDLHLLPDGRVLGFYIPENTRVPDPISGGTTGAQTFFDVGQVASRFHVEGTLTRGKDGRTVYRGSAQIGAAAYVVDAVPCRGSDGTRSILCR